MAHYPDNLYSLNLEKSIIGGFLNNPEIIIEINSVFSDKDFYEKFHCVTYSVIKNEVLSGKKIDKVLIAQKIKELGLSHFHDIDCFSYLDDLSFIKLNKNGIIETAKELVKLRIKRELWSNAAEVQSYIKESNGKNITEVISNVDKIYNSTINSFETDDNPCDLFEEAESIIKERVNNQDKFHGVSSPFPIFNDMFGNFRRGVTAICGRAKNNKSTILLNMGWGAIINNTKLKVLYLDTELKKDDHVFRSMAAFSQMNLNYLEDGNWTKNKELTKKLEEAYKISNPLKGKLFHHYIGNRPIEEIINIIRRWYFTVVGRGNPAMIILDYIKIGDEKLSNYNGEHQALGQKINALNAISQELNLPILSSMQLNRSAITDQKEDESAISMTDRLSWFANGVYIFRKKRPDEIADEGHEFGTHKLIPVVLRYQGKNTSLLDLVRTDAGNNKPTYKQNFINYNFSNFLLEERGTLRDIVRQKNLQGKLQNDNESHDNHI